ncbi:MAG: 4Fe-4S dicluster domain-containing protein [Candidatus Latescibacterota bacterium]|nr:4Fe-4S dicluster domain-containing protein [Candidatus Latescibacterota bacterium]
MRVPLSRVLAARLPRRQFVISFLAGVLVTALLPMVDWLPRRARSGLKRYLRPPGALAEAEFLSLCIRCGQCANVCPNKCITLSGIDHGLAELGTPRINARARGCVLCMACTQVCPTGALQPLKASAESRASVTMGTAFVAEDICYSFHGRTCGACYYACPLPGRALKVGLFEQPNVDAEHCVGCGLCEQACIHMPQAIRVVPRHHLRRMREAAA